jgi:ABC-type Fe3+/spermidine/putrescine transport system ATPase subunit
MKYIVKVKNITKKYGNVTAVRDVSFRIKEGEFFSLLGPSGCGKTTILRIIGGFIDTDNGTVLIDDADMTNVPPNKRNTSMVFQNLALFPHMNVDENIAYGLKKRRFSRKKIESNLKNIINVVNLKGFEKRKINQLSGGQQQRVALARSLILEPKILLLDEPLASLDKKLRVSMRMELKEIQQRTGTTFLYVTHDQSEALTMSDTVAVMSGGEIIQSGEPDFIYNRPLNIFVADFIGAGNFIPVEKVEHHKKYLIITTVKMGKIMLKNDGADGSGHKKSSGKHVFFIRPEKIKITADQQCNVSDPDAEVNQFAGEIVSRVFEGPDIRLAIHSEELGNITVELKNDEFFNNSVKDNMISFCWNISEGMLLPKS